MSRRRFLVVGHRGIGKTAPENTLLSFKKAIKVGCDRTELDVFLTKDKQIVCIHDPYLGRISDGKGYVDKKTLKEIRQMHCKENQKIPNLQDVIDICKGKIDIQIELKGEGTPKKVNDIILKNNISNNVVVTSFYPKLLKEFKKINPKIKAGILFRNINNDIWKLVKSINLEYICPQASKTTKEIVEKPHKHKLRVYTWHTNSKGLGKRLIKYGVDDIGTDFPEIFLKIKSKK
jgi:glycerophosphoryl diester phosphodiesterase